MWSALRPCLPVYFDLSPWGMVLLLPPAAKTPGKSPAFQTEVSRLVRALARPPTPRSPGQAGRGWRHRHWRDGVARAGAPGASSGTFWPGSANIRIPHPEGPARRTPDRPVRRRWRRIPPALPAAKTRPAAEAGPRHGHGASPRHVRLRWLWPTRPGPGRRTRLEHPRRTLGSRSRPRSTRRVACRPRRRVARWTLRREGLP